MVPGFLFVIAEGKGAKETYLMESNKGRWIGFAISGCFLGLIAFSLLVAVTGHSELEGIFGMVCHQFTDRCYSIGGVPLPVCVRGVGIYFGLACGHTLFIFWKPNPDRITKALIGVIALMLLDVLFEFLGFYHNWFWTRALTGFLVGLTVSHFTLLGLRELYFEFTNTKSYVRS